jgi:hypothetical protein
MLRLHELSDVMRILAHLVSRRVCEKREAVFAAIGAGSVNSQLHLSINNTAARLESQKAYRNELPLKKKNLL